MPKSSKPAFISSVECGLPRPKEVLLGYTETDQAIGISQPPMDCLPIDKEIDP
jgi:hypothetical protein